jgi:hypothetical protein
MKIHFNNNTQIKIEIVPGPATVALKQIYKHLQHAPLNYKKWDNPFYHNFITINELTSDLVNYGKALGIEIDFDKCVNYNQPYYNQLHEIYETRYNGDPAWLEFHEHIHLCETHRTIQPQSGSIDYREHAGPLTRDFNPLYLSNLVNHIVPGMVYMEWAELGKIPYCYWKDSEPDNLERLCQLAKPWLKFRPKLLIATQHINLLDNVDQRFHAWWEQYESDWCKHWNIEKWNIEHMSGVLHVGTITQLDTMLDLFKQQVPIDRVSLQ